MQFGTWIHLFQFIITLTFSIGFVFKRVKMSISISLLQIFLECDSSQVFDIYMCINFIALQSSMYQIREMLEFPTSILLHSLSFQSKCCFFFNNCYHYRVTTWFFQPRWIRVITIFMFVIFTNPRDKNLYRRELKTFI